MSFKYYCKCRVNKKSQASASQIFIYVFSAIIAALVLLYGYSIIKKMGKDNIEIQKMELSTELKNVVKETTPDYGTVRKVSLRLPAGYQKLCLVSSSCIKTIQGQSCKDSEQSGLSGYPIIKDSVDEKIDKNAFLYPDGTASFDVGSIMVYEKDGKSQKAFECYPAVNGKIGLYIEGKGRLANIYGAE